MEKRFHPFRDMKESAKAQHEVDKAQFEAVKARSKANWEEAKALGKTESRKKLEQEHRDELIAEANAARAEAEERIARLRNLNGKKD
ncbi:MAG: hypothetical protein ACI4NG_01665 [Candidatus Gallimonas sp.]